MGVLAATYGYVTEVILTQPYKGKSPAELLNTLMTLADMKQTPQLQLFSYQDQLDTKTRTHYGRITRLAGQKFMGADMREASMIPVSIPVRYLENYLSGG